MKAAVIFQPRSERFDSQSQQAARQHQLFAINKVSFIIQHPTGIHTTTYIIIVNITISHYYQ